MAEGVFFTIVLVLVHQVSPVSVVNTGALFLSRHMDALNWVCHDELDRLRLALLLRDENEVEFFANTLLLKSLNTLEGNGLIVDNQMLKDDIGHLEELVASGAEHERVKLLVQLCVLNHRVLACVLAKVEELSLLLDMSKHDVNQEKSPIVCQQDQVLLGIESE